MHTCRSYNRSNVKVVYVPSGLTGIPSGRLQFIENRCPVDACTLTAKSKYALTADVRLLRGDAFFEVGYRKPRGQIWVLWLLESPINTPRFSNAEGLINWTATYRPDSVIAILLSIVSFSCATITGGHVSSRLYYRHAV